MYIFTCLQAVTEYLAIVLASLDSILSKASVMDLFNLSESPLFSFISIKTIENSFYLWNKYI